MSSTLDQWEADFNYRLEKEIGHEKHRLQCERGLALIDLVRKRRIRIISD
jgi:hypothetical protein